MVSPSDIKETGEDAKQDTWTFKSIGKATTVYDDAYGCPRQGNDVPSARGFIDLHKELNPGLLKGLDEFSHCWIFWVFDRAHNRRAVIQPPHADKKYGALACRSPHRPNPIGMSVCSVDSVQGRRLWLKGLDLVNGTPILDIKPYHPMDKPKEITEHPSWVLSNVAERKAKVQLATEAWDSFALAIGFPDEITRPAEFGISMFKSIESVSGIQIPSLSKRKKQETPGGGNMRVSSSAGEFLIVLRELLCADPRDRQKRAGDCEVVLSLDGLCVHCTFKGGTDVDCTVLRFSALPWGWDDLVVTGRRSRFTC